VADVEELIKDNCAEVDVYHINHHGALTSSSSDFMAAIHPTVAISSNGQKHGHPRHEVIANRILTLNQTPQVYLTNKNPKTADGAWEADDEVIADLDYEGYDGMIEVGVWTESYRVWRWRDGAAIGKGDKYAIKVR